MKTKLYLLLSFSLLCVGACKKDLVQSPVSTVPEGVSFTPFPETNFNLQFPGYICFAISEYTDNGNLAVGSTSDGDIVIIKIDKQGNKVWEKVIGASSRGPISLVATSDNAYFIAGYADSLEENSPLGSFILKIDLLGNIIWVKSFNSFSKTGINSIIRTIDNNYIVLKSGGLEKVDKNGNILWSTIFKSDPAAVYAVEMIQDKNCDFVVAGWTCTLDFWLAKYNQKGVLMWEKTYGGSGDDQAFAITADRDNNYVIIGSGGSNNRDVPFNYGSSDAWLLKVNEDGNKIWSKTLGGSNLDNILSIATLSNDQYLVAGSTRSNDFDLASFNLTPEVDRGWLLQINADGTLDRQQIYQGERFFCIGKGSGDNYLIGGKAATSEEKSFWVLSVPAP